MLMRCDDLLNDEMYNSLLNDDPYGTGVTTFILSDGITKATMPHRHAIMCAIFWRSYLRCNIPIDESLIIPIFESFSRKDVAKILTKMYNVMMKYHYSAVEAAPYLVDAVDDLMIFLAKYGPQFVTSISLLDLIDIIHDPHVQAMEKRLHEASDISPKMAEQEAKRARDEFIDLVKQSKLNNNALTPLLKCECLNVKQIIQLVGSIGTRTDINDTTIMRPVKNSFMRGMQSVADALIESRSAVKVALYQKTSVARSQYMGKKIHLATMRLANMHKGSCGNPFTIAIKCDNPKNFLGKFIVVDGNDVEITEDNMEEYRDKIVNIVSPLTCRCTDGVCERCGGRILSDYLPHGVNIGCISSINLIGPATQGILSAKHLTSTDSIVYKLSADASEFFGVSLNTIYLKKKYIKAKHFIGIELKDLRMSVNDIRSIKSNTLSESSKSNVTWVYIKDNKGVVYGLEMETKIATPYLANEVFAYLKQKGNEYFIDDEYIWLPIVKYANFYKKNFKGRNIPFMRSVVRNNSMVAFVGRLDSFIASAGAKNGVPRLAKCTSCAEALSAFTDLVYSKIDVNIVHLEMILRSQMVTSNTDYSIPVVDDPDNVIFVTQQVAISHQSIGIQLANEDIGSYLTDPTTYLTRKPKGLLDKCYNI